VLVQCSIVIQSPLRFTTIKTELNKKENTIIICEPRFFQTFQVDETSSKGFNRDR